MGELGLLFALQIVGRGQGRVLGPPQPRPAQPVTLARSGPSAGQGPHRSRHSAAHRLPFFLPRWCSRTLAGNGNVAEGCETPPLWERLSSRSTAGLMPLCHPARARSEAKSKCMHPLLRDRTRHNSATRGGRRQEWSGRSAGPCSPIPRSSITSHLKLVAATPFTRPEATQRGFRPQCPTNPLGTA